MFDVFNGDALGKPGEERLAVLGDYTEQTRSVVEARQFHAGS